MLKNDIGTNAGMVWRTLSSVEGSVSLNQLSNMTGIQEDRILLALGWLSRENKIEFSEKEGALYISIFSPPSDWYF